MNPMEGFYKPTPEDLEKYKEMSVAVLMPCNDYNTPIRQMACTVKMMAYSWQNGLPVYTMAYTERTPVHWARNTLAKTFLESLCEYTGKPYTHALWIDDDQVFNPDFACRLAALGHLDMVSAVYFMRAKPHWPTAYVKDDSDNPNSHWPMTELPPCTVEVDAVGFGALLMRREVLEGMEAPWFWMGESGGEDIVFCRHAKEKGFRVWLCGDYRIGHLSGRPPMVTESDFVAYKETHPEECGGKHRIELAVAR